MIKEKSDLVPKFRMKYLGLVMDYVEMRAFPTEARIAKFMEVSQCFLALYSPPTQLWRSVLGHMSSLEKLMRDSRLRMRFLQFRLKNLWSTASDPPSQVVLLTENNQEDLRWWREVGHLLQGIPLKSPAPKIILFTDTSCQSWGALLQELVSSGVWTETERYLHINLLEMRVVLTLTPFQDRLRGHRVALMGNNVIWWPMSTGGGETVFEPLHQLMKQVLTGTESLSVSLVGRIVPGWRTFSQTSSAVSHPFAFCHLVLNRGLESSHLRRILIAPK